MNHDYPKDRKFQSKLNKARKEVARLDALNGYTDRFPGTMHSALLAGLVNPKCDAAWHALVMLEWWVEKERKFLEKEGQVEAKEGHS